MESKKFIRLFWGVFVVFCIIGISSSSFAYSLNVIGRIRFGTGLGSDCWGYTAPDSTEYALMGIFNGIAVVKADSTMQVIDTIPGPTGASWRDIKTYRNYAYAVSEMSGTNEGLMIMDLQFLPDSVHFVKSVTFSPNPRSHNMTIDTTAGYAYIQYGGGFRVVSLADPENPVQDTTFAVPGLHDLFARNDTVFTAEGGTGNFSFYDLSNKTSPQLIKRVPIPSAGIVHNIWASDVGPYVMTTEETSGKTVKVWNISDTSNIVMEGEYLGANSFAHNTHIQGNFAYISHYTYGIVVVDISDPTNPVEVAHYDTYPSNDNPTSAGCWGAYPFTLNGSVFASDMEGYLTVFAFDSLPVGVEERGNEKSKMKNEKFVLLQNFPNPFNSTTSIRYIIPAASHQQSATSDLIPVRLAIYDITGRLVETLVNQFQEPGDYRVVWDGRDSPSGLYFYRLTARFGPTVSSPSIETRRLILLK